MNNLILNETITNKIKNESDRIQNEKFSKVIKAIDYNNNLINIIPDDILEPDDIQIHYYAYNILERCLTPEEVNSVNEIISALYHENQLKLAEHIAKISGENLKNGNAFEVAIKKTSSKCNLSKCGILIFLKEFSKQIYNVLNLEFNESNTENWIERLKQDAYYTSPRLMCFALYCELTNQKELAEEAWNLI